MEGDEYDTNDTMDYEYNENSMVDDRNQLTYYLMGIGGMIVCCLGNVGNILSIIVLTRRAMRSSTYIYLAALAICDTLVLIFTMLLLLKDTKAPSQGLSPLYESYYAFLFPWVHPITITFQTTSIWLTLAFTIDRYIMICHPFQSESMCNRGRAKKVVIGIYIGGIIFSIPRFLEYYTHAFTVPMANRTETIYMIELTDMGNDKYYKEVVHSWLYLICVCGLPFLLLAVLNAFLIHAVHLSRKKGKEINVREKKRNDTTTMLIGVVITFLICQVPALVARMMWAFSTISKLSRSYHMFSEVCNFLVILNSAINIVPYYFFGKKFRKEFWRLFCACFFNKEELRKIARSMSVSVDHRKWSVASHHANAVEMNGLYQSLHGSSIKKHKGSIDVPLIRRESRSNGSEQNSPDTDQPSPTHTNWPNIPTYTNPNARLSPDDWKRSNIKT
ncbi:FMRFamide receptor isoform X2 [Patella vulgata]|uniref:FMRFamide receptor isoform X2 n=1 Tax=Patella vulgata TaxID=6465 RepID=UPI00217F7B54|nr:FMRFamide receptor isoform X2 [Patella vulgata]XP_050411995.1 FMRFamide receptor isoform X2 [Patella vulgata]XP_050411996.1 FMRFamide receptor isoform X2 [Patella vulgata]XP_050411997.1 FMRFamide receptor isoform X2 [Patella vulgata]XP_050411998.1 FMRFamide receptor isoform X2 [Patella vulgata]